MHRCLTCNDAGIANVADLPYHSDIVLVFGFDSKRMTKVMHSLPPKELAFACTEQYSLFALCVSLCKSLLIQAAPATHCRLLVD